MGTKKSEHIAPVLRSLYWLPVKTRFSFKILIFVYKSLNGLAPQYIKDMLIRYKPARTLRSTGHSLLTIPRTNSKAGEAAFCVYGVGGVGVCFLFFFLHFDSCTFYTAFCTDNCTNTH